MACQVAGRPRVRVSWSPEEGLVDIRMGEVTTAMGRRSMPTSQETEAAGSMGVDSSARAKSLAAWRREPKTNSYCRKLEKVGGTRGRKGRKGAAIAVSAVGGDKKEGRDGRSQEARAPPVTRGVQRAAEDTGREGREDRETRATSEEGVGTAPRSTGDEEEVTAQQIASGVEWLGREERERRLEGEGRRRRRTAQLQREVKGTALQ